MRNILNLLLRIFLFLLCLSLFVMSYILLRFDEYSDLDLKDIPRHSLQQLLPPHSLQQLLHSYSNSSVGRFLLALAPIANQTRPMKHILLFNPFYEFTDWSFGVGGPQVFRDHNCSVIECSIATNRNVTNMSDFDAIVFHIRNFDIAEIPPVSTRKPEQVYAVLFYESPIHTFRNLDDKRYENLFNWSISYRYDTADIVSPYGWISEEMGKSPGLIEWRHQKPELTEERRKYLKTNSRLVGEKWKNQWNNSSNSSSVVWLVSNCGETPAKRQSYVEELERYIKIDKYGACNHRQFTSTFNHSCLKCFSELEGKYKFILAFENSFCKGYITEKFWSNLEIDIIPVVRGGANYSEVAPPGSYIDAKDFKSVSDLAKYLNHLSKNKEEYENYFWWKEHYHINVPVINSAGLCDLCRRLHLPPGPPQVVNMTRVWSKEDCRNP